MMSGPGNGGDAVKGMIAGASLALLLAMGIGGRVAIAADGVEPVAEASFGYRGLEIAFAQPMQAWGNEAREDLVRLEPAVPVRCHWSDDLVLSCRPVGEAEFALATRYRIAVAAGLALQTGERLPALALEADHQRPTVRALLSMDADLSRIELESGFSLEEADLAAVLRLEVDGEAVPLPPLHAVPPMGSWDEASRFRLALPPLEGHDRRVSLSVVPGLRTADGPLRGGQDATLVAVIANEAFRLRGISCGGPARGVAKYPSAGRVAVDCMPGEPVALMLSSAPDEASREAFEAALPDGVRLLGWSGDWEWGRVTRSRGGPIHVQGHRVEFVIDGARRVASLSAALATLRAASGDAALEPVEATVRTADYRPVLAAARQQALLADGGQQRSLAEVVNAQSPLRLDLIALGAGGVRGETVHVEASQRRNEPDPIVSGVADAVLAEGGWARLRAPGAEGYASDGIEAAAPGFDLVAVSGRSEVLAWASAWEDGAAVAGAHVKLLLLRDPSSDAEVVARARTGPDGVARLELPQGLAIDGEDGGYRVQFPMWLLRAEAGRGRAARRTVQPLGRPWRYGLKLGLQAPVWTWGVADRPLYRAGDTVHYRLWQRRARGGRLQGITAAEPVELGLYHRDERKLVKAWPSVPATDGAIVGSLELPVHLSDGTYCIGTGDVWTVEGTCFFVGTYRAQDLWVEARSGNPLLRDGESFVVELQAGYYSGGAAAGVPVPSVSALLLPRALEDEYPSYADFSFVDLTGYRWMYGVRLADPGDGPLRTDSEGRLRIERRVEFEDDGEGGELPAFGQIQLTAEARLADREGTTSEAVGARYARYSHYVGLRLLPRWFGAHDPVEVEAVVIDAGGEAVDRAPVQVEVHYLPGIGQPDSEPEGEMLARCELVAGVATRCDFPRERSGRYRFTARSGDAAPAQLTRYVHVGGEAGAADAKVTMLELLEAPAAAGGPVRVLLRQPHERARVLFVHSSGDAILGHRLEEVDGEAGNHLLEVPDAGGRHARLTAFVVPAGGAAVEDGYRAPREVSTSSITFDRPARDAPAAVTLAFEAGEARPGASARIRLRNDGDAPRDVVLAVVDDALRSLGGRFLDYADPAGRYWLGRLGSGSHDRLEHVSFDGWGGRAFRLHLPWTVPGVWDKRDEEGLAGVTGDAAADQAAPEEPPVVFDAEGGTDVYGRPLAARSPTAPPELLAAPAPAPMPSIGGTEILDRIEVTGSRIEEIDAAMAGAPLHREPRPDGQAAGHPFDPLAGVRTHFADTALWRPAIHLAPGEERSIELVLPDNLTRWRAVAWSSDAGDGFELAEAALETGLPLEVRLQAPVRIYPGDAARLAANLRQSGAEDIVARASLVVEGLDAPLSQAGDVALAARGQGSFALEIAPVATGRLQAVATVEASVGRDAVAAGVEVASPLVEGVRVQAGWLQDAAVVLDLPELPPDASQARLELRLLRGVDALVGPWTRDLHDYPHRCWEQILSRAVAAALAIERGDVADWPEARDVVLEALDNAAVFQDSAGGFRFFAGDEDRIDFGHGRVSRVALAAYTLRVFDLLRGLGYEVPAHVDGLAREFLESHGSWDEEAPLHADLVALAAAAHPDAGEGEADALWQAWDSLALPSRIAVARVLAEEGHAASDEAIAWLLEQAPLRGAARVLSQPRPHAPDPWMSSSLREQCALIELLGAHPGLAPPEARRELVAGLRDLYAGGVRAVDTQAGAQCLIALRDLAMPAAREDIALVLEAGGDPVRLLLPAGKDEASRVLTLAPGADTLRIAPEGLPPAGASYVAGLRYQEDARQARPSAVGLSIGRRHEVLRDGAWRPLDGDVRVGDWLRITLVVETSATRHFVAVTDAVPGGLQPTDLSLGGIASLELAQASDEGSHWFGTRRLDPRSPRFYAEWLPAGRHEIHYFARAGNAGDYLAAPAVAELMYGEASRARTGAARVEITQDPM